MRRDERSIFILSHMGVCVVLFFAIRLFSFFTASLVLLSTTLSDSLHFTRSHFQHDTLSCLPRPYPSQPSQRLTPSTIVRTNKYFPLQLPNISLVYMCLCILLVPIPHFHCYVLLFVFCSHTPPPQTPAFVLPSILCPTPYPLSCKTLASFLPLRFFFFSFLSFLPITIASPFFHLLSACICPLPSNNNNNNPIYALVGIRVHAGVTYSSSSSFFTPRPLSSSACDTFDKQQEKTQQKGGVQEREVGKGGGGRLLIFCWSMTFFSLVHA